MFLLVRLRLASLVFLTGFLFIYLFFQKPTASSLDPHPSLATNLGLAWGVATRIFVVSLPKRSDRRASLLALWRAHRLDTIHYINAKSAEAPEIDHIIAHVRRERKRDHTGDPDHAMRPPRRPSFRDSLDKNPKEAWGSDLWTLGPPLPDDDDDLLDPDALFPLSAAQGNPFKSHKAHDTTQTTSSIRRSNLLTRAMVACWYSHLEAIRQIATLGTDASTKSTYIVLEDDIDVEWNIQAFLMPLWKALPNDWDIVMLGHCWSDEARYSPLIVLPSGISGTTTSATRNVSLHPANSPLCTHAYALTTKGATTLYNHLRHPAFAYSRALDQAIAWLIRSKNLKNAYSIVPSLIIQTKDSKSDISGRTKGSRWRDTLMDSTHNRLLKSGMSS